MNVGCLGYNKGKKGDIFIKLNVKVSARIKDREIILKAAWCSLL